MIVNLYGRHPSIESANPTPCDLSIGINHIPLPCDWICFGDVEALWRWASGEWPRRHRIGLIGPASFEFVNPVPSLGQYRTWQSLATPVKARKSGIMALLAAVRFGAREIRTWGMRMQGDMDFDGLPSYDNPIHGAARRWEREREAYRRIVAFAGERGATVTAH